MSVAPQGVLSSVPLSEAEGNMKHNLCHTQAYQEDLLQQMAAAETSLH